MSEGNWGLNPEDLRWGNESPKSGMLVKDMYSKVVVEHIPTGIVVEENTHRHQYRNREVALSRLAEKVKEIDYV